MNDCLHNSKFSKLADCHKTVGKEEGMFTRILTAIAMGLVGQAGFRAEPGVSPISIEYTSAWVGGDQPHRRPLLLDLYLPDGARSSSALHPAILVLHGGAFKAGTRSDSELVGYGRAFAKRGYAVVAIDYRLSGDAPRVSSGFSGYSRAAASARYLPSATLERLGPTWPNAAAAAAEDSAAALKWIVAHANDYHIDPRRVVLLGASAGAITALNLAYLADDNKVRLPPIAAVIDVRGAMIDDRRAGVPATMRRSDPPLLIIHGTSDQLVPFAEAVRLYRMAESIGLTVEFHPFRGMGHELGGVAALNHALDSGELLVEAVDSFLRRAFERSPSGKTKCVAAGGGCPNASAPANKKSEG
jgi:acetyl esterase/lipase